MQAKMAVFEAPGAGTPIGVEAPISRQKSRVSRGERTTLAPDVVPVQASRARWLDWSRRAELCDTDSIVGRSFRGASG
jgi:hypothetical protein